MNTRVAVIEFTVLASLVAVRAWGQSAPAPVPAPAPAPVPVPPLPALAPAVAAGGSAGSDGGSAGSGTADGAGPESAKNKAADANLDAQESLPQLTAARGGSLGIPSSIQTAGLHAAVDAKFFDDKANTDAFAQLAGLVLSPRVSVDVVGQTVTQDVQRFVKSGSAISPQMYDATLSSAGLRARFRSEDILVVSKLQNDACMAALRDTVPDNDTKEQIALIRLIGDAYFGLPDENSAAKTQIKNDLADEKDRKVDPKAPPKPTPPTADALKQAQADIVTAQQDFDNQQKVIDAIELLSKSAGIQALDNNSNSVLSRATKERDAAKKKLDDAKKIVDSAEDTTIVPLHDRYHIAHNFLRRLLKPKVDAVKSKCNLSEIKGIAGWSIIVGAHALRRSAISDDGQASIGGALEAMFQYDSLNTMGFGGLSFEYMNSAVDKDSGSKFIFPSFHALRLSGGVEYRGSHPTDGTDLLPRIGAYGVASVGWWRNNYRYQSQGGTGDLHIWSTELEAGVYAGGKFSTNFTGMLALRVLKSFGDFDRGTTFIVSLIPAVSAGK